ncbi:MAG TPA: glycosyltransferase [Patescibacteria group bacterium]|nr:glycosyltransferase [Patescibacteria group bacterium]
MKVAIITCYKYPDYGRAVALRAGLKADPDLQTIIIKNSYKGPLRYPEVFFRTFWLHLKERPNVYLLTFRGYEMLPAILLIALRKPVVLDELVNPMEVVSEHRQLHKDTLVGTMMAGWSMLGSIYNLLLRRCWRVIADTSVHAAYSAKLSGVTFDRYRVVPVGADESIFKPPANKPTHNPDKFTVLYYGSMVPLHGLDYVLYAAERLKDHREINFILIGGGQNAANMVATARAHGAIVEHREWIEPTDLPELIGRAGLCLGGPFGNTVQSQLITTGKTYQFLACGAPVLIGETKETLGSQLFIDKTNCLMVPQGSAQAIADAVLWAVTNRKELGHIGQAGNKLYEQEFSQLVISQKLSSMLAELPRK